jgi:hypothetical protein
VFITALVHNLVAGGRLPLFEPVARGRIRRCYLQPQPDDGVPRFAYEEHLAALFGDPPEWPESTRSVSQLRVTIEYEPEGYVRRSLGLSRLHVDIVDYPGEWLLDLPLLETSYRDWSAAALERIRAQAARPTAAALLARLGGIDAAAPADEQAAIEGAALFTAHLRATRGEANSLSTTAPGRFLLPGGLEGTPALTFVPLAAPSDADIPAGSNWALMKRRYDYYVGQIVKPFFRDHFARLDRQIVLVDALSALNAGPAAVADLERALTSILSCYRVGAASWLSNLFARRIDRVLFAATKADHLHQSGHQRLTEIVEGMTERAKERASFAGAQVMATAIAAVRSTREAEARRNGVVYPVIVGVPLPGEQVGGTVFDGIREMAIFPGDLADWTRSGKETPMTGADARPANDVRFVRFRPMRLPGTLAAGSRPAPLPNIRLDRALEFLLGDRLL